MVPQRRPLCFLLRFFSLPMSPGLCVSLTLIGIHLLLPEEFFYSPPSHLAVIARDSFGAALLSFLFWMLSETSPALAASQFAVYFPFLCSAFCVFLLFLTPRRACRFVEVCLARFSSTASLFLSRTDIPFALF